MQGQGIFYPNFYQRFRPFYPASTFSGLQERCQARGFTPPYLGIDLGCGTGHSCISALRAGVSARIIGVDPDPEMLHFAKLMSQEAGLEDRFTFILGQGEKTTLPSQCADFILIGSAFHWMNPELTQAEVQRLLKPRGLLRIFEYQFPKALDHPELNEWIRRNFNQQWKAPAQVPRGSFQQITSRFRNHASWTLTEEARPKMILNLNTWDLLGLILSQSRVYHYETSLSDSERDRFREDLHASLSGFLRENTLSFDFKLSWIEFSLNESKKTQ